MTDWMNQNDGQESQSEEKFDGLELSDRAIRAIQVDEAQWNSGSEDIPTEQQSDGSHTPGPSQAGGPTDFVTLRRNWETPDNLPSKETEPPMGVSADTLELRYVTNPDASIFSEHNKEGNKSEPEAGRRFGGIEG